MGWENRPNHGILYEAVSDGLIDVKRLAERLLRWFDDSDLEDFIASEFPDLLEDDEE